MEHMNTGAPPKTSINKGMLNFDKQTHKHTT